MIVSNRVTLLVIVIGTIMAEQKENKTSSNYEVDVQRLRRLFFEERKYDAASRPTNDTSEPTVIDVAFFFKSVMHVKGESDWFTGTFWMCASWHDHRLTWNEEEFDNRTSLHFLGGEIWSPNFDVINAMGHDDYYRRRLLIVESDGTVWACFSARFKMPCPADRASFLNGEQVCTIRVVTMDTYESSEVKLVRSAHAAEEVHESGNTEWNVINISYANYTELNRPFLDVSFHLRRVFKRHRYVITAPLVAMTLVMLAAFWMPPASERRLTLAGLTLLVGTFVLGKMTTLLGLSSVTSNILLFLGIAMATQAVTAAGNVLVLKLLSSRTGAKVPDVIYRALSGKAAAILCLCDHEPEMATRPEDAQHPHAFDEFRDRRRRWLLAAQAVDRLFFIVVGFTAVGLLA